MTDLPAAALAYAARGWPVFPCSPGSKKPAIAGGVLSSTCDPRQIEVWWNQNPNYNIGIDCGGAGLMVMDVDPGAHPDKVAELLSGSTTLAAQTPRDGVHYYFAIAGDEQFAPSASKVAPHVDIRSHHSYVLAPPSVVNSKTYAWIEPAIEPAFRPEALAKKALAAREKHKDRDDWKIDPDMPENVARAAKWLKDDAEVAVEGQGGDACAYATAAHLRSLGISPELSLDLMVQHWNPRNTPPWEPNEAVEYFASKIDHATAYATSPPGNITTAYHAVDIRSMFTPIVNAIALPNRGKFTLTHIDDIEAIRPPEWVLPGWLPQGGYSMLVGPPRSFKSFVALDLSLCVAAGPSWPERNWVPTASGPVLYASGEGRYGMRDRIMGWRKTWGSERGIPFVLCGPVPFAVDAGHVAAFVAESLALQPSGYALLVIDTAGRSMQGLNENAQEDAGRFSGMVALLQEQLGREDRPATVLVLHHTNKGGGVRGSSVFGADADTVIMADREEWTTTLTLAKQKDAPDTGKRSFDLITVPVAVDRDTLVPRPAVVKPKPAMKEAEHTIPEVDEAIVAVLSSNPSKPWSTRALADAVAMRTGIEVGSEALRKYLPEVREDKTTQAHRMYDPMAKVWLYKKLDMLD